MKRSGSFVDRCGRYTRQPGSALRTAATCSLRSAASASPLPFVARTFAITVSTSAMGLSPPSRGLVAGRLQLAVERPQLRLALRDGGAHGGELVADDLHLGLGQPVDLAATVFPLLGQAGDELVGDLDAPWIDAPTLGDDHLPEVGGQSVEPALAQRAVGHDQGVLD